MCEFLSAVKGMDNWEYLFTFGYTADVYACGNKRKMVDKKTGEVICQYSVNDPTQGQGVIMGGRF